MRRAGLISALIAICALATAGASQAASTTGYPSTWVIAHQVKKYVNDGAQKNGYKWRYTQLSCVQQPTEGVLLCSGVGRWSYGFGRVMDRSSWIVTTTTSGDWTAKSEWIFSGHVAT
jgi:hypothetical protein